MTKKEVLDKLAAKLDANRAELRRQLEVIANLPGHEIYATSDVPGAPSVDLMKQLSETWKEGNGIRELALEFVPLIYPDEPAAIPPEARPS